jgi:structural maintenance of chromosome 2
MYIEELIIDGFKSYSTRVHVGPFDKQFNAITGLNGSGKSNILDSICFVLGISNLSHVRVGNLSELVYKQGQAGVTKASVTVVFNNQDKSNGPVGYENHDRITITRQIVIGGRNRYLLNQCNVQANQIQNFFHSVSLNVNNPHFLIMQGRITKVINMKPQETLSMIEEAAGTRMYENKKAGALKTLEKKQSKVDEINKLLAEDITPTLKKLQKERENYQLWLSNQNEMERLQKFCVAFEYVRAKDRLENKNQQMEEMAASEVAIKEFLTDMATRAYAIEGEITKRTKARDQEGSKQLTGMQEAHAKTSKEIASMETKLKNLMGEVETHAANRKKTQHQFDDMRKQVESKDKVYQKEKEKYDAMVAEDSSIKKDIEKAQWQMQAVTAGMAAKADGEAESKSLREQLMETTTNLNMLESEGKKKAIEVQHLKDRIASTEQAANKSKQDGKRLAKEKDAAEKLIKEKTAELEQLGFDPEAHKSLTIELRKAEDAISQLQYQLTHKRAQADGLDFHYAEPHKGFKRSSVKGLVAKLFNIQPDYQSYAQALEITAGGKLFNVVVDNEETAKALLERGQLRRRVTIIPLNKIAAHPLHPNTVRSAKQVMPAGGEVYSALQIVGFDKELQTAMEFIFGGCLVCDTAATAKQVTFHPNVRVRSVTKEGDEYNPSGTITGGSAPKGGGVLSLLQEVAELEKQLSKQMDHHKKTKTMLDRMSAISAKYFAGEHELKCKQHDLELVSERISQSEFHVAEQALQDMRAKVTQWEADIKNLPETKKELEKKAKQLDKEIKSLDSGREERIKFLEGQVAELKAKAQQQVGKLEKQRERTEQASVELEVLRNDLQTQEAGDQSVMGSSESLQTEIEGIKATIEEKNKYLADLGAKIEQLQVDMKEMDQTLSSLSKELADNKRQQEEKELEHKRIVHKMQQLEKEDAEAGGTVAKMEQEFPWIETEKGHFGKPGTDYDFKANNYQECKDRYTKLHQQQNRLSKNINKKARAMFEKAEQEYKDLLEKREIIVKDRKKIEQVIKDLDKKKVETLRKTWAKVNKDFDSIFSTLLPFTNAKLEAPPGMDPTEGLEIKVAFNGVWKASLTELSGGQRSLLALSLVLALLLFKPAPMYILDEIDSALDLSHTQNIGHMIRTHFPHSQFIIVSLKEGMFNHANVLFRTRFVDGTSNVSRYAIRDEDDRVTVPGNEISRKRKASQA